MNATEQRCALNQFERFALGALAAGCLYPTVSPERCMKFRRLGLIDSAGRLTDAGRRELGR